MSIVRRRVGTGIAAASLLFAGLGITAGPAFSDPATNAACNGAFEGNPVGSLAVSANPAAGTDVVAGQTISLQATWTTADWNSLDQLWGCFRVDGAGNGSLTDGEKPPANDGLFAYTVVVPDVPDVPAGAELCARARLSGNPTAAVTTQKSNTLCWNVVAPADTDDSNTDDSDTDDTDTDDTDDTDTDDADTDDTDTDDTDTDDTDDSDTDDGDTDDGDTEDTDDGDPEDSDTEDSDTDADSSAQVTTATADSHTAEGGADVLAANLTTEDPSTSPFSADETTAPGAVSMVAPATAPAVAATENGTGGTLPVTGSGSILMLVGIGACLILGGVTIRRSARTAPASR